MKESIKKSLSILTAAFMLVCLLPMGVNARSIDNTLCTATGESIPGIEPNPAAAHTQAMPKGAEIWDGSIAESFAGGSGTETDPFLVSNGAQFAYLAQQVNLGVTNGGSDYADKYFEMTNDICLNDTANWAEWGNVDASGNIIAPANTWTTIGWYVLDYDTWEEQSNPFNGVFDGNGFKVSGLYLNKLESNEEDSAQGLFGVNGGAVKNIGIEESYIHGDSNIGAVAGKNLGSVDGRINIVINCQNAGKVSGNSLVGGIVGINDGIVEDCFNTCTVNGTEKIGGIVGWNNDTVKNCCNLGEITGTEDSGGVVGANYGDDSGMVEYCRNLAPVNGESVIGGVIGYNSGSRMRYCYNIAEVTADFRAAGVCGWNNNSGTITNCYNTGTVESPDGCGGVTSYNRGNSMVQLCYNAGSIIGEIDAGAVIGRNQSTVQACYYLDTCLAAGDLNAQALTDEQMRDAANYEYFDFTDVWTMDGNLDYPYAELIGNNHQIGEAPPAPPTEEPPTEEPPTEEPPTEEPPTEEPPTEEPPTEEPPTEEPPTEEPPTEEPPTEEPPTEEPPTEEPPTETPTEPPAPPITGFVSLAGAGIAAILAGAGVVLFKRKKD